MQIAPRILDQAERVIVGLLLGSLLFRLVPSDPFSIDALPSLLILAVETAVVGFLILRRSTEQVSLRWGDWLLGFAGTAAPLLAIPASGSPLIPLQICVLVMMVGTLLNFYAKFSLRRSFGLVAANRGVKIEGPYRVVRHPMYAGYLITHIGFILSGPNIWNIAIYAFTLACQVFRMNAEERILQIDPKYREMMVRVRFRLFPGVY